MKMKQLAGVAAIAAGLALPVGWFRELAYLQEPGQRWERVAVQQGAIYSSSPTVLRSGIVYESIGSTHYVLRWLHGPRNEEFDFAGDAFHPVAATPDGPVLFELVANGRSQAMQLDVRTRRITPAQSTSNLRTAAAQLSPDGRWIVSTKVDGSSQVWVESSAGGSAIRLTGGHCSSFAPVWELDSQAIVFANDCSRGIGLPALYRARLDHLQGGSVR